MGKAEKSLFSNYLHIMKYEVFITVLIDFYDIWEKPITTL